MPQDQLNSFNANLLLKSCVCLCEADSCEEGTMVTLEMNPEQF